MATILDDAGQSPRQVADQLGHSRTSMTQDHYIGRKVRNPLGHSRPSMTQDSYLARGVVNPTAAAALDAELGGLEV